MCKRVFIGGPITNLIVDGLIDPDFKRLHENIVISLKEKGYNVLSAHIAERYGENLIFSDIEICKRDLTWIKSADLCIFILPVSDGSPVRTDGTYIEIGYALANHKRCIIFWNIRYKSLYSPMFRGISGRNVRMFDLSQIKDVIERHD